MKFSHNVLIVVMEHHQTLMGGGYIHNKVGLNIKFTEKSWR